MSIMVGILVALWVIPFEIDPVEAVNLSGPLVDLGPSYTHWRLDSRLPLADFNYYPFDTMVARVPGARTAAFGQGWETTGSR